MIERHHYRLMIVGLLLAAFANIVIVVRFGGFYPGNAAAALVCLGAAYLIRLRMKDRL